MTQLFQTLGFGLKDGKRTVTQIYIGFDGAEAQAAYEAVLEKGHDFSYIESSSYFNGNRLGTVKANMVGTTPVFPKSEGVKLKVHSDEGNPVAKREAEILAARQKAATEQFNARFGNVSQGAAPKPETKPEENPGQGLKQNGPTLEEWVGAGYQAADYPPAGYAERDTEGLKSFRASQQAAGGVQASDTGEESKPSAELPGAVPPAPPAPPAPPHSAAPRKPANPPGRGNR